VYVNKQIMVRTPLDPHTSKARICGAANMVRGYALARMPLIEDFHIRIKHKRGI
jgi:hypothetical protein